MSEKKDDSKKTRIKQGIAGSVGLALILGAAAYNGYLEVVRLRKLKTDSSPLNEPTISSTETYDNSETLNEYIETEEDEQLER